MSNVNAHQEAKPQTLEANSSILIDSAALGKKDYLQILHVDDDLCLLEVSKQILSMENNFEIENVTSVDEAFKKLQKQTFDAVISDYEMPQKNGLEFLKELREEKNDVAFILFTGKGREDVAVKALNLGADRYIDKNGSPETVYCELAYAINKIVERKKSRELLAKSEEKYRTLVENSFGNWKWLNFFVILILLNSMGTMSRTKIIHWILLHLIRSFITYPTWLSCSWK